MKYGCNNQSVSKNAWHKYRIIKRLLWDQHAGINLLWTNYGRSLADD